MNERFLTAVRNDETCRNLQFIIPTKEESLCRSSVPQTKVCAMNERFLTAVRNDETCRNPSYHHVMHRDTHVYIIANVSRTTYIGVTMDLEARVWTHRMQQVAGFTRRYHTTMLVYVETFAYRTDAIAREKELKGWRREKKVALIESLNPEWRDLSMEWYE